MLFMADLVSKGHQTQNAATQQVCQRKLERFSHNIIFHLFSKPETLTGLGSKSGSLCQTGETFTYRGMRCETVPVCCFMVMSSDLCLCPQIRSRPTMGINVPVMGMQWCIKYLEAVLQQRQRYVI